MRQALAGAVMLVAATAAGADVEYKVSFSIPPVAEGEVSKVILLNDDGLLEFPADTREIRGDIAKLGSKFLLYYRVTNGDMQVDSQPASVNIPGAISGKLTIAIDFVEGE